MYACAIDEDSCHDSEENDENMEGCGLDACAVVEECGFYAVEGCDVAAVEEDAILPSILEEVEGSDALGVVEVVVEGASCQEGDYCSDQ